MTILRLFLTLCAAMLGMLLGMATAAHVLADPPALIVIDGDTVRVGPTTYRIIGMDAPETGQAKCDAERVKGEAAKLRMADLLASSMRLEAHGLDRYRRRLARIYIWLDNEEHDVADIMIAEGHARPYSGKSRREGWC